MVSVETIVIEKRVKAGRPAGCLMFNLSSTHGPRQVCVKAYMIISLGDEKLGA